MRKTFVIMIAVILLAGISGCKSVPAEPSYYAGPSHYTVTDAKNASNIALAINAYNTLNPDNMLPDDVTLEDAKEVIFEGGYWWPRGLPEENEKTAWEVVVIKDGKAYLREVDAWQAN